MLDSAEPTLKKESSDEGYLMDVAEVAALLGVTRTRVSQLTSNGQLSFERRRIGMRNKLFYKRSEVLAYQQTFYGRHLAGGTTPALTASGIRTDAIENSNSVLPVSEERLGGASAGVPRHFRHMPEHLLLETQKLLEQESLVELRLMKLGEQVQSLASLVKDVVPKDKPSARALAMDAEKIAKLDKITERLEHLDEKMNLQKFQFETLSSVVAGLQKHLHRLSLQKERHDRVHKAAAGTSAQDNPSSEQRAQSSSAESDLHRKARRHKISKTTFKKHIAKR
ncbi:MAG: hypothetical protein RIR26_340 [Pseudomonadota bacterium]|jgi:uncharacterized coiled-coil protein SlyX